MGATESGGNFGVDYPLALSLRSTAKSRRFQMQFMSPFPIGLGLGVRPVRDSPVAAAKGLARGGVLGGWPRRLPGGEQRVRPRIPPTEVRLDLGGRRTPGAP